MVCNLVCEEYAYCGNVRSVSYDKSLKITFVNFTGSVVKAIPDCKKIHYALLTNGLINKEHGICIKFSVKK